MREEPFNTAYWYVLLTRSPLLTGPVPDLDYNLNKIFKQYKEILSITYRLLPERSSGSGFSTKMRKLPVNLDLYLIHQRNAVLVPTLKL